MNYHGQEVEEEGDSGTAVPPGTPLGLPIPMHSGAEVILSS